MKMKLRFKSKWIRKRMPEQFGAFSIGGYSKRLRGWHCRFLALFVHSWINSCSLHVNLARRNTDDIRNICKTVNQWFILLYFLCFSNKIFPEIFATCFSLFSKNLRNMGGLPSGKLAAYQPSQGICAWNPDCAVLLQSMIFQSIA